MAKRREIGASWVGSTFVLVSNTATIKLSGPKNAKRDQLRQLIPVWLEVAKTLGHQKLVDDLVREGKAIGLQLHPVTEATP